MSETLLDDLVLEEINCARCGIRFGVSLPLLERRRNDHDTFYCPNGHGNVFPMPVKPRDDELEDLRVELRETKDALARERADYQQLAASRRPLLRRHK